MVVLHIKIMTVVKQAVAVYPRPKPQPIFGP